MSPLRTLRNSLLLALLAVTPATALDLALYGELLSAHTREVTDLARTRVDYGALAASPEWQRLVQSLAATDPTSLGSADARLAFWINAYNILAMDLMAANHPVESIRDIGSLFSPVWKRPAGTIAGKAYTLDEIEHGIVRKLGDPRAHAAVICASTSCPALRREPFDAERLDAQLDDAMRRWMADPGKGLRLESLQGAVRLSKIFDWFEEDFAPRGGALAFAARYASDDVRAWIAAHPNAPATYFDYDWRSNGIR